MADRAALLAELQRRAQGPDRQAILAELERRGVQLPQAPMGPPEPPPEQPGLLSQMVGNIPSSAAQFAQDIAAPITSPVETGKALGNVALGAAQKLIPGEQGSEQYADAVGKFFADRYGGMDALKKTMAEDPVGFVADLSTVLTGGGSLAARLPGAAGKVGKVVGDVGRAVEPATQAGKAVGAAGRAVGTGVAELLGVTSGVGGEAIKTAARAGQQGGEIGELLRASMRGKAPLEDTVTAARAALQQMRLRRGEAYRSGMKGVVDDTAVLDWGPVDDALGEIGAVKTFKGRSISKSTEGVRKQIADEITEWKALDPAEYHTVEGFDALKQSLGDIMESTPYGSPERKVAQDAYNAIKQAIVKQAPDYAKVMQDYWTATEHLKEIEKALSLGPTAATDTALRKLQSIVRNDVSSAYGKRGDLAADLERAGATGLKERVAGQALANMAPRGLSRLVPGVGVAGAMIDPTTLAVLPLSSPRLVGEAAHALGRVSNPVGQAMRQIRPEVLQSLMQSGRLGRMP